MREADKNRYLMSGNLQKSYPESIFGGFSRVDGTIAFFSRVNALLRADSVVVDFGCGRGEYTSDGVEYRRRLRMLRGKTARVIGIDVSESCRSNQAVDEAMVLKDSRWPLPDASVDLVLCDHVLEHLEKPEFFFSECHRVLKPGGFLCARTPNRWSYVAVLSRVIPERLHGAVLKRAQRNRSSEDIFPTYYRANSRAALSGHLGESGFQSHAVIGHNAEPAYFDFSSLLYKLAVLYQRYSPEAFKVTLFVFAQKS